MKHVVLARKWRPKQFKDLVGQTNSIKVLTNIISQDRLHHAYLLTGTRGVGKTTIARIIAKALNCLSPVEHEPCGVCDNCLNIEKGSFVDVIEIDAASNTGVDNIREIIENAQYMPSSGKYKIFIIDEVHMLSKSAFNAMLKTLEEPPSHVIFILATTDLQKVPITVVSRCLQLRLKNLLMPEISDHLAYVLQEEQINFEKLAIDLIASAANGSMRDALSILDQAIAFSDNTITQLTVRQMLGITDDNIIIELINAISNRDSTQLMSTIHNIQTSGNDYESILSAIQNKLIELQLAQLTNNSTTLSKFIDKISINDVQLYFEIATLGIEHLKNTHDKYPVFVMTLLRMLAFTIGNGQQKEIVIQNSNFNVSTKTIVEPNNQVHETVTLEPQVIENSIEPTPVVIINSAETINEEITDNTQVNTNNIKQSLEVIEETIDHSLPWATDEDVIQETDEILVQETPVTEIIVQDKIEVATQELVIENNVINESPINTQNVAKENWVEFIEKIKPNISHDILPQLENSQLESKENHQMVILIDKRYHIASNNHIQTKIIEVLNNYFTDYSITLDFNKEIHDSLRIKTIRDNNNRQQQSVESINNDPKIQLLINEYGAEIIKDSIKPLE